MLTAHILAQMLDFQGSDWHLTAPYSQGKCPTRLASGLSGGRLQTLLPGHLLSRQVVVESGSKGPVYGSCDPGLLCSLNVTFVLKPKLLYPEPGTRLLPHYAALPKLLFFCVFRPVCELQAS